MATSVAEVLAWLEQHGTKKYRDGLARYGIVAPKAFGVSVGDLSRKAKSIGRDHELAQDLWKSGWYEARMMVAFLADPELLTPTLMNQWTRDFDNWAICDHLCFHLYDRSPHAMTKVTQWSGRRPEFVKRAAFALLASVALHDKRALDAQFLATLPLIKKEASDERNFVKKGVSWALRGIGHRNAALRKAAMDLAARLAESDDRAERWVGKDVLRDLSRLRGP